MEETYLQKYNRILEKMFGLRTIIVSKGEQLGKDLTPCRCVADVKICRDDIESLLRDLDKLKVLDVECDEAFEHLDTL